MMFIDAYVDTNDIKHLMEAVDICSDSSYAALYLFSTATEEGRLRLLEVTRFLRICGADGITLLKTHR
jgi:hypothetical protein